MNWLVVLLVAIMVIAAGVGAYSWLSSHASEEETPPEETAIEPWQPDPAWTAQAGEEFATLSESARCDLIFAIADLQDERTEGLLLHALDDPSETVAIAAAHVLCKRGAHEKVRTHVDRHPGERAQRISETLALLQ